MLIMRISVGSTGIGVVSGQLALAMGGTLRGEHPSR